MITCDLQGGLGNLLFQISATYATALENSCDYYFDLNQNYNCVTKRFNSISVYKNNIFRNVKHQEKINHENVWCEPSYEYHPIKYKENILLSGYFQSNKYFEKYKENIFNLFSPNEEILKYILNKYGDLFKSNTCSLHVRRGDYLNFKHIYRILDKEYYNNALSILKPDKVFVFSDSKEQVRSEFVSNNFIHVDEPDYIELYIMSLCKNNIIANSTFSWWGAYLNQSIDKKVISPVKWFNNGLNEKDLIPQEWIKI